MALRRPRSRRPPTVRPVKPQPTRRYILTALEMHIVYFDAAIKSGAVGLQLREKACVQPIPKKAATTKPIAGICRLKSMVECKMATAETANAAAGRKRCRWRRQAARKQTGHGIRTNT